MDPNPEGASIAYLPFEATAKATLFMAGLDFRPLENVRIMPNIQAITYDEVAGEKPGTDLMPRLTFYYIWK